MHSESWIPLQRQDHVRSQRVDGKIGAAFAQFESARGCVRHNDEAYSWQLWLCAPIVFIARNYNFLIVLGADETKRSRADRLAANLVAAAVRHDTNRTVG